MEDRDDIYDREDVSSDVPHESHAQHGGYDYQQRDQFYHYDDGNEPSFFGGALWNFFGRFPGSSANTGGNLSIFTAILCICLFQFRDVIFRRLSLLQKCLNGNVADYLFNLYEYLRSYVHMAMDVLRNLRFLLTSSTGTLLESNVDVVRTRSGKSGRSRRRRRFRENNSSVMPELEEIAADKASPEAKKDSKDQGSSIPRDSDCKPRATVSQAKPRVYRDEIEPAFLNEKDYPPGWLVYHPVLGVVSKTEADRYRDEEELRKNSEVQPVMAPPAINAT